MQVMLPARYWELAEKLGGKGGGKPDFAMGGAPAGQSIEQALESISIS